MLRARPSDEHPEGIPRIHPSQDALRREGRRTRQDEQALRQLRHAARPRRQAGQDAARFFLVARKADAEFVFDINLAQQKSDENPVYYLQYAHARICSVFANAKEKGYEVPSADELIKADLSSLVSEQAMDLMAKIAEYPSLLTLAAKDHAPHCSATT